MYRRKIESILLAWKQQSDHKPIVIKGCRQCGKTSSVLAFARQNYRNVVYLDFHEHREYKAFFAGALDVGTITLNITLGLPNAKFEAGNTCLVFDEIQDCNEALNSLKYFKEKCPELAVMAAGSLLGVKIGRGKGGARGGHVAEQQRKTFPVGMVELLDVEPLDFVEYLEAKDE